MHKKQDQFVLIVITLSLSLVLAWFLYFKQAFEKDTVDIKRFPKTIGAWTSVDLPITKDEYAILETTNAFVRQYTHSVSKEKVYLYIVYSQHNRKVAHPPEICYTGSGYSISQDVRDVIAVKYKNLQIQTNRLKLTRKGGFEQISYYWFKVGGQFTPNYWKQQFLIGILTLIGQAPSSALIRISADVSNNNTQAAVIAVKKFTNTIMPDIFKYLI